MSVSAASSVQKMQITCQIMYTGNILGTMSVSGFIPENSSFELSVGVSVRFGPPGIWSDRFAPSMVVYSIFPVLKPLACGRHNQGTLRWTCRLLGSQNLVLNFLCSKSLKDFDRDYQRKTKGGGGENSGEGKTYHKTPPQKRFWTPPLMIRFPLPLCSRNVILLRGNGHRPDNSHFLRPPKLVLEGVLYGTFPPPKKIARYVLPPLCEFPKRRLLYLVKDSRGDKRALCSSWNLCIAWPLLGIALAFL